MTESSELRVVLLSGPIAVGKTAIANVLIEQFGFRRIKSSGYLIEVAKKRGMGTARSDLQNLGDELDLQTDYRWLIDDVTIPAIRSNQAVKNWLVDSVRKDRQIHHFRNHFKGAVRHVHLDAPDNILEQRYLFRQAAGNTHDASFSYELATSHQNEASARALKLIADMQLDTLQIEPELNARRIMGQ